MDKFEKRGGKDKTEVNKFHRKCQRDKEMEKLRAMHKGE
jgi:hypothetical protein